MPSKTKKIKIVQSAAIPLKNSLATALLTIFYFFMFLEVIIVIIRLVI